MNAVIIFGAGGFLGKNLKKQLSANILYKNYKIISFTKKNLNLENSEEVNKKLNNIKENYNVKKIFHCAVVYNSAEWVKKNPAQISYKNNLINLNAIKYSQLHFPKCIFICMLSYALYNKYNTEKKLFNDYKATKMLNSYSDTKFNLLKYCNNFYEQYKFNSICFVISNLYGNEKITNEKHHFVSSMIKKINLANKLKLKKLTLKGNFTQKRDFLHIEDACLAIIKISRLKTSKGVNIINLGYGKSFSMKYFIDKIIKLTKYKGDLEIISQGEIIDKKININKLKNLINWKPKITIHEGLKKTVIWSLKNQKKI